MNIFYRTIFIVYTFFTMCISAVVMIFVVKPEWFESTYKYIRSNVISSWNACIIIFVIAVILFVVSLLLLFLSFKHNRDKRAVSRHNDIGELKISLNTIENIALAATKKFEGVKGTRVNVKKINDDVSLLVNTTVMTDIDIPALSRDIQEGVKKLVEESSGVKVNDVKILVENTYSKG